MILTCQPAKSNYSINGTILFFQEVKKTRKIYESLSFLNTRYSFNHIKGSSPAISKIKELAMKVSSSDSTILLTGESGTGKEIFARAIHSESKRNRCPFIAINCSAIPDALLESELFGYEAGSFTGANKNGKIGKFELAHNGTIFLDEIGDMPMNLQSKLLRVLQDRIIERIGGNHPLSVDVRIITATNKNLEELIKISQFREDLYYRIKVIPLHIPSLKERKEDILLLADHFLRKHNVLISKDIDGFDSDVIEYMLDYNWPGNIRELENVIEYGVNIETTNNFTITSLPFELTEFSSEQSKQPLKNIVDHYPLKTVANQAERQQIRELISVYGNTTEGKKQTAKHLSIGLSTLYRKIKELDTN